MPSPQPVELCVREVWVLGDVKGWVREEESSRRRGRREERGKDGESWRKVGKAMKVGEFDRGKVGEFDRGKEW